MVVKPLKFRLGFCRVPNSSNTIKRLCVIPIHLWYKIFFFGKFFFSMTSFSADLSSQRPYQWVCLPRIYTPTQRYQSKPPPFALTRCSSLWHISITQPTCQCMMTCRYSIGHRISLPHSSLLGAYPYLLCFSL